MRGTKGQFFIIASILITLVMFGMISVSTYTIVKEDPRTVNEISEELNRESLQLIDYGIYNRENITDLINNFTSQDVGEYFLQKTNDANIVFVYGDRDDINAIHYSTESTGEIGLAGSTTPIDGTVAVIADLPDPDPGSEFTEVNITLGGDPKKYFFELKDNKMFYFVVVQKRGEEIFVNTNQRVPADGERPGGGLPFGLGGVQNQGEKVTVCWKGKDKAVWETHLQSWLDRGAVLKDGTITSCDGVALNVDSIA
jgi:hypothetical protein